MSLKERLESHDCENGHTCCDGCVHIGHMFDLPEDHGLIPLRDTVAQAIILYLATCHCPTIGDCWVLADSIVDRFNRLRMS